MMLMTSRLHGMIDYIVGIALIAAPWLFGFADFVNFPAATWAPVTIGFVIIAMSLVTDYEYSYAKIISLRTHLGMDFILAAFLAVSPWLLNFADYVYAPHMVVGLIVIMISWMTVKTPYIRYSRRRYIERHV